jgi:hypothetical protein
LGRHAVHGHPPLRLHADSRELEVLFVTGRRYLYADVPPEAAAAFRAAFSKGSHFNRHIRDRYRCRELVD